MRRFVHWVLLGAFVVVMVGCGASSTSSNAAADPNEMTPEQKAESDQYTEEF
ncbi:hypothetical protein K227x_10560 [Rubripirellula lacrimiformis]|uniref:Uncharacterized protein n=1 Tax=Rubripirellula lacrimiformis TaxID=1930273 RepID=A0A517N6P2_9BACT|nr:hypothetical protein [Rubripirellula lacrimiformis]QDT02678.1 hypothetical protein K227x_10560 [Rubripirellula lacrimiformis]